jgi:hypothetical protein
MTGSGTQFDPYIVLTASDLADVATNVNADTDNYRTAYYLLMDDIDLSAHENWTPIGISGVNFDGDFNGNGHKICNLSIINSTRIYIGLFGAITGTVYDLMLDSGTVINSKTDVTITIGAICGYMSSGASVDRCVNKANVTVTGAKTQIVYAGGVVGYAGAADAVRNCFNYGAVAISSPEDSTNKFLAGVVGGANAAATIARCINVGAVSGAGAKAVSTKAVQDSYYDNVKSLATDDVATGLTTIQMTGTQGAANMNGLDYTNIWFCVALAYPVLRVFIDISDNTIPVTTIKITPPNGNPVMIDKFSSCDTVHSMTDRAGEFDVSISEFDNSLIDAFPVGSVAEIVQGENRFVGWVSSPPVSLFGVTRSLTLSGQSFMSKTQKIVVNENFDDKTLTYIVDDLFSTYMPYVNRGLINTIDMTISINFPYMYLWDAMEQICKIGGCDWFIDEDYNVVFFRERARLNTTVLSQTAGNYERGSASFNYDAGRLVNKLWVIGITNVSDDYDQTISVSGAGVAIPLHYAPKTGTISVVIGGSAKTVGIDNIDARGTKDFLINANEKVLVPDLVTTGTGTVTYKYEYPIRVLLQNTESQDIYGVFEDVMRAETNDNILSIQQAQNHLFKYSSPVLSGKIRPFEGTYKPGDIVKVEIDDIGINTSLQVKDVSINSIPGEGRIETTLSLEQPERDLQEVIRDINNRLKLLEKSVYNDDGSATAVSYQLEYESEITAFTYNVCSTDLICDDDLLVNTDLFVSFEKGEEEEYFRKAPTRIEYNGIDDATFTYFINLEDGNDDITALSVYGDNVSETAESGTKYATEEETITKNNTVMITIIWRITEAA